MIRLSFAEFFKGEFEDCGYELYLVRDGEQVMYIGVSRVSVWERWFAQPGSHMVVSSTKKLYGISTIGEVIGRRLPAAWDWIMELWTKEDCCNALTEEIGGQNTDAIRITDLEAFLINRYKPLYNATHGGQSGQDPLITKALDEAYKKIFEKDE